MNFLRQEPHIVLSDFVKNKSYKGVLILPFAIFQKKAVPLFSDFSFKEIDHLASLGDFQAKESEISFFYPMKGPFERVLLLGLGEIEKVSPETIRRTFGGLERFLASKKWFQVLVPNFHLKEIRREKLLEAFLEGFLLSSYQFSLKKEETAKEYRLTLLDFDVSKKTVEEIVVVIKSVFLARDLANGNADLVTPGYLAKTAKSFSKGNLRVSVLGKKELEKEKMGLLLAVGRGAKEEPKLILGEYIGDPKSKDLIALVGKGVTFDTGGLNLKPSGSIETQKADMSGAAAVLGALIAARDLKLKVNLIAAIPTAENAIDSLSYKPGDVYKSFSGKTVEITNTDAEGRLIVADAIAYVKKKYPITRLIDLATLTGAILVTFGHEVSGMMSNDETLSNALIKAGENTFERVWPLPIYPEWRELLKSDIADISNSGGRLGSSITAALFLKEFVGDTPWAHLDIAGTAFLPKPGKYCTKGATGVGVRLLIEYFKLLQAKPKDRPKK